MKAVFARPVVALLATTMSLYGCATASKDIVSTYVSPVQYQSYDCEQIGAEVQRISGRVNQLGGRLDEAASNDKGIAAIGIIIFWPALFALGGTKQQEAEYARLKGEYDALEQQAVMKKCSRGAPPATVASQSTGVIAAPATPAPATSPQRSPQPLPPEPAPALVPAAYKTVTTNSKYMFNAERFAKDAGCVGPVASMNIRTAVSESFTIACSNSDPLSIRCENGQCRQLQ